MLAPEQPPRLLPWVPRTPLPPRPFKRVPEISLSLPPTLFPWTRWALCPSIPPEALSILVTTRFRKTSRWARVPPLSLSLSAMRQEPLLFSSIPVPATSISERVRQKLSLSVTPREQPLSILTPAPAVLTSATTPMPRLLISAALPIPAPTRSTLPPTPPQET